jgi:type IV pilus assembly protein PilV
MALLLLLLKKELIALNVCRGVVVNTTKKYKKYYTNRGFTLLEVMMAMAIFTIGILAIVGIQHMIVRGNTNGNVVTQQLMLAQRVMEQLKNNPDPNILTSSVLNSVDVNGDNGGPYNVTSTVTNPIGGNSSRYITITVTKNGPGGHPITIQSLTHGNGI